MLGKLHQKVLVIGCAIALALGGYALVGPALGQTQDPDGQATPRQIRDKVFTGNRPAGSTPASASARSYQRTRRNRAAGGATATARPPHTTTPTPSPRPATTANSANANVQASIKWEDIPETADKVGVTIWRLRPEQAGDTGARLMVQRVPKVPERVASDAVLSRGDQVFLSVESPRAGYLYIIDREMYADGTVSDPYLIFPTRTTRGGDNRVEAGKLIGIPDERDNPNVFTLEPQPPRNDQVGEHLSIVITNKPLETFEPAGTAARFTPADALLQLRPAQIAAWEARWGGRNEQFDLDGGAGQTMTLAEQDAAKPGVGARLLIQAAPAPQTVYLVESKSADGLLVSVQLRYR